MVRFGLNENLYVIASKGDLDTIVFFLITWAVAQGRIVELVTEAWKANPGNPSLKSWVEANPTFFSEPLTTLSPTEPKSEPSLSHALLRERITQGLSRSEVGMLWYDLLGSQMDDEMPGRSQPECVIELLTRANRRNLLLDLLSAINRLYPHISLTP